MASGRIDGHSTQSDNKYKSGLKWEFNIGILCLRGDVARLHDRHQWRHDNHVCLPYRAHQHEHLSVPCLAHLVSAHRHTLHMHRMKQVRAVSVISLDFDLSFLFTFPHAPLVALLPFLPPLEARRQPAHSAQREYGARLTRRTPTHVMSPTPTTSRRLLSSPTRSSWPRRRSSPTKGFPRTPSAMTPHSRVCFVKLTKYIAITLNEKSCLSVSRRPSPSERSDPLGSDQATCWTTWSGAKH